MRDDYNDQEVEEKIAESLLHFSLLDDKHVNEIARVGLRNLAKRRSGNTSSPPTSRLTPRLSKVRSSAPTAPCWTTGGNRNEQINFVRQQLFAEKPNWNRMMVDKTLPKRLHALEELSRNLWWCWNPAARATCSNSIDHDVVGRVRDATRSHSSTK